MRCHFCKNNVDKRAGKGFESYDCPVCGSVDLVYDATSTIETHLSDKQKDILRIVLRNDYENRGRKPPKTPLNLVELDQLARTYQPLEYIEQGETEPKFTAVKIDGVEHINDINDEIIAQIRRSRFMVCGLTGYRGGVYFEAGFAYGLGLDVIYTCRKDWSKEEILKDVG